MLNYCEHTLTSCGQPVEYSNPPKNTLRSKRIPAIELIITAPTPHCGNTNTIEHRDVWGGMDEMHSPVYFLAESSREVVV